MLYWKKFLVRCVTSYKIHPDYFFENKFFVEASSPGDAIKKVKEMLPKNEVFDHANMIKEI